MAKGQVTEEQLASGLKGIGDFGSLAGPRVRRDNPFRDSRPEIAPAQSSKTIELPPVVPPEPPASPNLTEPELKAVTSRPKPVRTVAPVQREAPQERGGRPKEPEAPARKADLFTERVTLQISPEMRDDVDALARDLQRAKTTKDERITANTVMRVALQLVINNYGFDRGDVANSESELYALVARKLKLK